MKCSLLLSLRVCGWLVLHQGRFPFPGVLGFFCWPVLVVVCLSSKVTCREDLRGGVGVSECWGGRERELGKRELDDQGAPWPHLNRRVRSWFEWTPVLFLCITFALTQVSAHSALYPRGLSQKRPITCSTRPILCQKRPELCSGTCRPWPPSEPKRLVRVTGPGHLCQRPFVAPPRVTTSVANFFGMRGGACHAPAKTKMSNRNLLRDQDNFARDFSLRHQVHGLSGLL